MNVTATVSFLPLVSLVLGALIGLGVGRYLAPRIAAWLLGLVVLAALVLIIRLVLVQPGNEEAAFAPFVWLNAGVFPALFSGVMGWLGGRALRKRADGV